MKSKTIFLIVQALAWLVFLIFPGFVFSTIQPVFPAGSFNKALAGILFLHSLLIAFYYFNYYYLIPKFYFSEKYKMYFPVLAASLLLMVVIMELDEGFNPFSGSSIKAGDLIFIFSIVVRFAMIVLLSLGIASYNRLKQTEEGKLKAELSYLKAQINPHFLFNTLNSIYALTVKKSDAAPESVTKLSAIMRYSITDAVQDYVSLDKELNYTDSYIELEKLRLTDKVHLTYKVTGETAGKQIAPLIFLPFIENAFKYGVSTRDNSEIVIKINIENNLLDLYVMNTKAGQDNKMKTGLGIENSKRRLNLLYPGKHDFEIKNSEKEYSVHLTIKLHD